jgi:asparagine synthase (glutamine-hydrolysing)
MCGIFAALTKGDYNTQFQTLQHRGPDRSKIYEDNQCFLGFHRLCIHDTTFRGDQPLELDDMKLICNGEIYNYKELNKKYNFPTTSDSDCEVILHCFKKYGNKIDINFFNTFVMDGVFAFVLKDGDKFWVARDYYGVRPLFYGIDENGIYYFSSEMKALSFLPKVNWFPPGHYWDSESKKFQLFKYYYQKPFHYFNQDTCKELLTNAVVKRLSGDRPIGFLLSGGLDSSIVCKLGQDNLKRITTFSIGYEGNSRDLKYSSILAKELKSNHHVVRYNFEQALEILPKVIEMIETYDITTIRASVPHYLIGKYIKENTDIKIVLSGEGADEIFGGYLYFHNAPSVGSFKNETMRLLDEIYMFDVLRSDRCMASHGLEVRVPFLDKEFVKYVMQIDTNQKMVQNYYEKYYLRKTFEKDLPMEIVWRRKDGFSDSNGNFVNDFKEWVENQITSEELRSNPYGCRTKEELYYRRIYESMYPNRQNIIPHHWMPKWQSEELNDPSGALLMNLNED